MSEQRDEIKRKDELAEKVADIRFGTPHKYGTIANNLDVFDDVVEKAENGYFTSDGRIEGHIMRALADADIIDVWGEHGPRYYTEDTESIREFEKAFREFDSRSWSKRDIHASLKAISEHILEEKESVSSRDLRDIRGAPSSRTVYKHHDSWNDVLFFAGLPSKRRETDREEIQDRFRKKFYELGRLPRSVEEFYNDPDMPSRDQVRNEFGSYDELIKSEFPYRLGKDEQLGNNYDIVEARDFDYGKWEVDQDNEWERAKAKP